MTILHGDNQIASRNQFLTAKQEAAKHGLNIVDLSGDNLQVEQLIQATESKSLFGSANAVFIENLFSSRPSATKKQIIEYLIKCSNKQILIWESKDVSTQLKDMPSLRFDLPKHIFKFLDDPSLSTFHLSLSTAPVVHIFASLSTRLQKVFLCHGRFTSYYTPHQF